MPCSSRPRGPARVRICAECVKKAVIGVGHGEKQQIHMMLKILMPKAEFKGNDAADALAIAICHAHNRGGDRMRRLLAAG